MARIKVKLTEMKNADVQFISLVTAGANRIPFRVIKSLKESEMSVDLSSIRRMKSDKPVPTIVGVVVKADDAQLPFIAEAVKAAGLVEDKVSKYEDGTVMFAQGEVPAEGEGIMVRLSDKLLVVLKNADDQADVMTEASAMSEALQAEGFYHGGDVAQKAYAEIVSKAMKSEDGAKVLKQAGEQFTAYMGALAQLVPAKVAELDDGIGGAIQKAEAKKAEDAAAAEAAKKAEDEAKESAAKKAKAKPAEGSAEEEASETAAQEAAEESAAGGDDGDDDNKGKGKNAKKMDELLAAVAALTETVTAMKADIGTVKDSQSKLEGQVADAAQKAEKANKAVDTTVVASAAKGDDEPHGRRAAKSDEDPRSGFFDTAFLPKRK
jgi:hypothetical protein